MSQEIFHLGIRWKFQLYHFMTLLAFWSWCLVDLFVFCDLQQYRHWKLSFYLLERNSNFLFIKNRLFLMYSFGSRPITPVYVIISWCLTYRLSRLITMLISFWKFRLFIHLMTYTLTFGLWMHNLELRGMETAI